MVMAWVAVMRLMLFSVSAGLKYDEIFGSNLCRLEIKM